MRGAFVLLALTSALAACDGDISQEIAAAQRNTPNISGPKGILQEGDMLLARMVQQNALETLPDSGRWAWTNGVTGNSGSVTPSRSYQRSDGMRCRDYVETIRVHDRPFRIAATACRDRSGTWQAANHISAARK